MLKPFVWDAGPAPTALFLGISGSKKEWNIG